MNKIISLLLVLIFLIASSSLAANPAFSSMDVITDSWTAKAAMHEARGGLGVAKVNDKIYAIGGSTRKGLPPYVGGIVGTNEEYDPTIDTWTVKTSMPTPRSDFTTIVYQNKIYCIGGTTSSSSSNGLPLNTRVNEVYDPATDTWETKTPMPTQRDFFAAVVYQNKIYCIGGTTGSNYTTGYPLYTGLHEVYDPATDTWETKTPMPTAKVVEANVVNGKIYLIGGAPNNTLNQVYDPSTDSWNIKAPMPTEAYGASVIVDNKIYVIGGSYSEGQYYTLNQIYEPDNDKWILGTTPPSGGVRQRSVVATTGEKAPKLIYVLDEVTRVYDPETDSWTFGANIITDRLHLGVVIVKDMLYAIGGNTYTGSNIIDYDPRVSVTPYTTNEQYTPIGYGTIPQPTPTPTSSPEPKPFPTTIAVASIAIIAVIGVGILVYFKKYRK